MQFIFVDVSCLLTIEFLVRLIVVVNDLASHLHILLREHPLKFEPAVTLPQISSLEIKSFLFYLGGLFNQVIEVIVLGNLVRMHLHIIIREFERLLVICI